MKKLIPLFFNFIQSNARTALDLSGPESKAKNKELIGYLSQNDVKGLKKYFEFLSEQEKKSLYSTSEYLPAIFFVSSREALSILLENGLSLTKLYLNPLKKQKITVLELVLQSKDWGTVLGEETKENLAKYQYQQALWLIECGSATNINISKEFVSYNAPEVNYFYLDKELEREEISNEQLRDIKFQYLDNSVQCLNKENCLNIFAQLIQSFSHSKEPNLSTAEENAFLGILDVLKTRNQIPHLKHTLLGLCPALSTVSTSTTKSIKIFDYLFSLEGNPHSFIDVDYKKDLSTQGGYTMVSRHISNCKEKTLIQLLAQSSGTKGAGFYYQHMLDKYKDNLPTLLRFEKELQSYDKYLGTTSIGKKEVLNTYIEQAHFRKTIRPHLTQSVVVPKRHKI